MKLLDIVKILSMLASGVFGALAVLTDYRDENKRLTRWGKFALAGQTRRGHTRVTPSVTEFHSEEITPC